MFKGVKKHLQIVNNDSINYSLKYYNILLSLLSLLSFKMLYDGLNESYNQDKISSLNNLICKKIDYTDNMEYIIKIWYYSKFLEWIDTFYLILKGKKISFLHFSHHASTALLAYLNSYYNKQISQIYFIAYLTNSFAHTFMYFYYAYPRGMFRKYRKSITSIQIMQHVCVLSSIIIGLFYYKCLLVNTGLYSAIFLYSLYLIEFIKVYIY